MTRKALVLGFFSTIGDLECLEFVVERLASSGIAHDVAAYSDKIARALAGSLRLAEVRPRDYTHLIIVCGPIWPGLLEKYGRSFGEFAHCFRIGINLTLVEPLAAWNPFDLLIERDSDRYARPDLTFAVATGAAPVLGICVIERQKEYGARQGHGETIALFNRFVARTGSAHVDIDTRWPQTRNAGELANAAQVASVMRRMDVVLTNRLHGLVFGLKSGVPVIAIDSVKGGGKVSAQARTLGWPACTTIDEADDAWMDQSLAWCLGSDARTKARECAARGGATGDEVGSALERALREPFAPTVPPADVPGASARSAGTVRRLLRKLGGK